MHMGEGGRILCHGGTVYVYVRVEGMCAWECFMWCVRVRAG